MFKQKETVVKSVSELNDKEVVYLHDRMPVAKQFASESENIIDNCRSALSHHYGDKKVVVPLDVG